MEAQTLKLVGVDKVFAGVTALNNVSLELNANRVTGIIGPNGSGKTTLFNVVTGFEKPTRGRVEWDGNDISGWAPHRVARRGLVRTFQQTVVFAGLTVWENIEVAALATGAKGRDKAQLIEQSIEMMEIESYVNERARALPFGVSRRVGIACVLPLKPALLLLDEPAAGMNDEEVAELSAALFRLREDGFGLAMVDHNMEFIGAFCEHIAVMNAGEVLLEGDPTTVLRDRRVAEVYLGDAAAD